MHIETVCNELFHYAVVKKILNDETHRFWIFETISVLIFCLNCIFFHSGTCGAHIVPLPPDVKQLRCCLSKSELAIL